MNKPFNQYKIMSSHNSYLAGAFQIFTCKSPHGIITKLLKKNFRAIELDVYYYNHEIMVFHGQKTSCCVPLICSRLMKLTDAFDEITDYIDQDQNETTPIIIFFEDNVGDVIGYEHMYSELEQFSLHMFGQKLRFNVNTPDECKNKILIAMNKTGSILDNKINFMLNDEKFMNTGYPNKDDTFDYTSFIKNGGIVRRYPLNTVLSRNYENISLLNIGTQFVCINAQEEDQYYVSYMNFFKNNVQGYL
jgi:hypothetical protein